MRRLGAPLLAGPLIRTPSRPDYKQVWKCVGRTKQPALPTLHDLHDSFQGSVVTTEEIMTTKWGQRQAAFGERCYTRWKDNSEVIERDIACRSYCRSISRGRVLAKRLCESAQSTRLFRAETCILGITSMQPTAHGNPCVSGHCLVQVA